MKRLYSLMRGFNATVIVSGLGLILRLLLEVPYPPQELFNRLSQFMGTPAMFQLVHQIFGYGVAGKVFAFTGSFALWVVALSLLGLFRPWLASLLVFLACVALVPVWVAVGTAGGYYAVRHLLESPRLGDSFRLDRRNALGWLTLGSGVLVAGGATTLLQYIFGSSSKALTTLGNGKKLPGGITAQADFYSISKNLEAFDPKLNADKWQLKVSGLVKTPRQYTLKELRAKPRNDLEATMVCISNAVGGGLIGNAIWNGFRLRDLLLEVGIEPTARFINWKAADGYTESLPLAQALEDDVLLVYGMNNEALSQKHGFPLRVLIPGRLGMKQPRWITEIELSDKETIGYWVERGWSRTAYAQTMSRIDSPDELAVSLKALSILEMRGIAFAGSKTITKVEVSTDGGQNWREAELIPRRSSHAWQQWRSPWMPGAGSHQLTVRAYADGVMQPEEERDALPEASSGWHHFITTLQ
jgi:DMSO/TMAO reductase YedYZ molybdopterin-dependent catalytic subunit